MQNANKYKTCYFLLFSCLAFIVLLLLSCFSFYFNLGIYLFADFYNFTYVQSLCKIFKSKLECKKHLFPSLSHGSMDKEDGTYQVLYHSQTTTKVKVLLKVKLTLK